jgi:hypothetical protein
MQRGVDIVREAVEVVDAQRFDASVQGVGLVNRGQLVHPEVELERDALRIDGLQRAALIRLLDETSRQAAGLEKWRALSMSSSENTLKPRRLATGSAPR